MNKSIRNDPRMVTSTDVTFNKTKEDAIDEPILVLHVSEDGETLEKAYY